MTDILRKSNRISAKNPSAGKFWCDGCDANLVGSNETCSVCGSKPRKAKKQSFLNINEVRQLCGQPYTLSGGISVVSESKRPSKYHEEFYPELGEWKAYQAYLNAHNHCDQASFDCPDPSECPHELGHNPTVYGDFYKAADVEPAAVKAALFS